VSDACSIKDASEDNASSMLYDSPDDECDSTTFEHGITEPIDEFFLGNLRKDQPEFCEEVVQELAMRRAERNHTVKKKDVKKEAKLVRAQRLV